VPAERISRDLPAPVKEGVICHAAGSLGCDHEALAEPHVAASVELVMLKLLTLIPFIAGLALSACAKADPVADNAVAPPDELVGDASATGLAAPANVTAGEAAARAALPAATGGLAWSYRASDRIALFGPPDSPAFSIQCQVQREGQKELLFVRAIPATAGGKGTLSFTGNGQVASVPVTAVANPIGPGGNWRAVVAPDEIARDVGATFAGPGTVEVSISGYPPLVVPSSGEPRRVFAECLGR